MMTIRAAMMKKMAPMTEKTGKEGEGPMDGAITK
jgi:hypothetical protein